MGLFSTIKGGIKGIVKSAKGVANANQDYKINKIKEAEKRQHKLDVAKSKEDRLQKAIAKQQATEGAKKLKADIGAIKQRAAKNNAVQKMITPKANAINPYGLKFDPQSFKSAYKQGIAESLANQDVIRGAVLPGLKPSLIAKPNIAVPTGGSYVTDKKKINALNPNEKLEAMKLFGINK